MAWIGIRPLAMSWPPERRAADANGAAHRFSKMSTPAVLPGSIAAARWSTSSAASSSASWASMACSSPSSSMSESSVASTVPSSFLSRIRTSMTRIVPASTSLSSSAAISPVKFCAPAGNSTTT